MRLFKKLFTIHGKQNKPEATLGRYFEPPLSHPVRHQAKLEGWTLGVSRLESWPLCTVSSAHWPGFTPLVLVMASVLGPVTERKRLLKPCRISGNGIPACRFIRFLAHGYSPFWLLKR
jgi:hypothetical protein